MEKTGIKPIVIEEICDFARKYEEIMPERKKVFSEKMQWQ